MYDNIHLGCAWLALSSTCTKIPYVNLQNLNVCWVDLLLLDDQSDTIFRQIGIWFIHIYLMFLFEDIQLSINYKKKTINL